MRIALSILGGLLVLIGTVWILQGINILPGSFMTGDITWAIVGGVTALAGGGIVAWANR